MSWPPATSSCATSRRAPSARSRSPTWSASCAAPTPVTATARRPRPESGELDEADHVPFGIQEPGTLPGARLRDAALGLERRIVVLLEDDAAALEIGDLGLDVGHREAHLGVGARRLARARRDGEL